MEKRKLLQKYDIPISHLDYVYIGKCTDARELEKIVTILQSGEEGYYPDLTKCAEDKLREMNPNSKALRKEERILTKNSLSSEEWEEHSTPIKEWSTEIKDKDSILSTIQEKFDKVDDIKLPPIRKGGRVTGKKDKPADSTEKPPSNTGGGSCVGSTDYRAWDKFDADAEILKMDLEEERVKEHVERMNKINKEKSKTVTTSDLQNNKKDIFEKLSKIEKEKLSEECRIRGNEYFRSKEYENALKDYTCCLDILPTVAAYNNRAITNIKLLKYADAMHDCDECLKLDPRNLKAFLRKGEALLGLGNKIDACSAYEQAKAIDPSNEIARKALTSLKTELGEMPPINATRINISEENNSEVPGHNQGKSKPAETPKPKPAETLKPKPKPPTKPPAPVNYNYAELIKPNKIVKSTLAKTMENLGKLAPKKDERKQQTGSITHRKAPEPEIKIRLEDPGINQSQSEKCLIQEL